MQKRLASKLLKEDTFFYKNKVYKNISPRKPKPWEGLLNVYTLTCYNKSIINSNQEG